jgi:hypothetical protein
VSWERCRVWSRRLVRVTCVLLVTALVTGLAIVVAPVVAEAKPSPATADVGPAEAADLNSARATARLQNRRIEALSERTESDTTSDDRGERRTDPGPSR